MDYIFTSSIIGVTLLMLAISYDVACQWWIHFLTRIIKLPSSLQRMPAHVIPLVPKFHLQSHAEKCHSRYSFNYCKGGARTDGEGVERNWDELNGQAPSTAEMLPGHRWETLDDCCGWANWRKSMGLGVFYSCSHILDYLIETRRQFTIEEVIACHSPSHTHSQ